MTELSSIISQSIDGIWAQSSRPHLNENGYRSLIQSAYSGLAVFITRPGYSSEWLDQFLKISEECVFSVSHSWIGTHYCSIPATVYQVSLSVSHLPLLSEPKSLWNWRHPQFPEDLAFINEKGQLWFFSTTHEGLFWYRPDLIPWPLASCLETTSLVNKISGPLTGEVPNGKLA